MRSIIFAAGLLCLAPLAFAETLDEVKASAQASCEADGTSKGGAADKVKASCSCTIDGIAAGLEEADAIAFLKILSANAMAPADAAKATGMSEADAQAVMERGMKVMMPLMDKCK